MWQIYPAHAVQWEVMQMGKPLECSMIAPGQSINPLQFTKLHNKTISKHFYDEPNLCLPLASREGLLERSME